MRNALILGLVGSMILAAAPGRGGGSRGSFSGGSRGGFSSGGSRGGFGSGGYRGGYGGYRGYGGIGYGSRGFGGYGYRSYRGYGYGYGGYGYGYGLGIGLGIGYGAGYYGGFGYPYASIPYYSSGIDYGGYYPDYGYSSYQSVSPTVVNQYYSASATTRSTAPLPVRERQDPPAGRNAEGQIGTLIAFPDGSVQIAVAYWTEGQTLHYVTRDKAQKQVSLAAIDRAMTEQLNRERHMDFRP